MANPTLPHHQLLPPGCSLLSPSSTSSAAAALSAASIRLAMSPSLPAAAAASPRFGSRTSPRAPTPSRLQPPPPSSSTTSSLSSAAARRSPASPSSTRTPQVEKPLLAQPVPVPLAFGGEAFRFTGDPFRFTGFHGLAQPGHTPQRAAGFAQQQQYPELCCPAPKLGLGSKSMHVGLKPLKVCNTSAAVQQDAILGTTQGLAQPQFAFDVHTHDYQFVFDVHTHDCRRHSGSTDTRCADWKIVFFHDSENLVRVAIPPSKTIQYAYIYI